MQERMNIEQNHRKHVLKERRLLFSKAKLKAVARTSALLSGFAMVAMVEISFDDHKHSDTSILLIMIYSILTCLVVGVHLLALMISTCTLPLIEADHLLSCEEYKPMYVYVEFAWILSTGFGMILFFLELIIVCWVKFFFITHRAAIATTIITVPMLILFCVFSLHFYRRLGILKLSRYQNELHDIEQRLTIVEFPIVNII